MRGWNASATSAGTTSSAARGSGRTPLGDQRAGRRRRRRDRRARSSRSRSPPSPPERRGPGPGLGRGRGVDLGRGQHVGERVEVVADADPALGDRLERDGAPAAERVEHDVARSRPAGDEGVAERRREAREVRAHRVEAVAPEPLLVLPLRGDRQLGQAERQLEGELARRVDGPSARHAPAFLPVNLDPLPADGSRSIARPESRSGTSASACSGRRGRTLTSELGLSCGTVRRPGVRWRSSCCRGHRSRGGPVPTVGPIHRRRATRARSGAAASSLDAVAPHQPRRSRCSATATPAPVSRRRSYCDGAFMGHPRPRREREIRPPPPGPRRRRRCRLSRTPATNRDLHRAELPGPRHQGGRRRARPPG